MRAPLPTPRYSVSSELDSNDVATKRKAIAIEVRVSPDFAENTLNFR